ncbi:MAG: F0F1 ATP synthase subunit B [Candidatus Omnitrophica bacterium]|nr:F0F1 ATP synthase subunit B [Candidatus Omnitrophota bacterium]
MEPSQLINFKEVILQVINFFLVLILLKIFLWKKLLKVLDDRKMRITSEFQKIEDTKAEVARIKADYEAKVSSIADEARHRIQQAIEEGKKMSDEIHSQAHRDAQDIIENAKASMLFELAKARQDMRKDLVELTMMAAENLIEEKLTTEQDKKLVEDFLKRIDEV